MQRSTALLALPLAALTLAWVAPAQADESVTANLSEFNGSGASGTAQLTANDDGSLTVDIQGTGYTPNMPHAQHIHGAVHGSFMCPTADADKNGDGQVSTEEGLPQYGDIFVSLTTHGDTSKASGLAVDRMPVADAQGNLEYSRTIAAADLPEGTVDNLENLHVVQHGLDVNGNDKYDLRALGKSVFAEFVLGVQDIPEEATNPATCGMVVPAGSVETGAAPSAGQSSTLGLYGIGGIALAGAGAAFVARRRLRGAAS